MTTESSAEWTFENLLWRRELTAPPWHGGTLLLGLVLTLGSYLLASLIVAKLLNDFGLVNSPVTGIALFATQLAMLLPALIVAARYRRPLHDLGFRPFRWLSVVELFFALGLGFSASILWGLFLLFFDKQAQPPILPIFGDGVTGFVVAYVVGALVAPLVEEVVFRGFLFGGLLGTFSAPVAMALSALVFAGLHLQPFAFPVLFILGLLMALLYYRSGSLWLPILMHFVINSVGLCGQFALQSMGV